LNEDVQPNNINIVLWVGSYDNIFFLLN